MELVGLARVQQEGRGSPAQVGDRCARGSLPLPEVPTAGLRHPAMPGNISLCTVTASVYTNTCLHSHMLVCHRELSLVLLSWQCRWQNLPRLSHSGAAPAHVSRPAAQASKFPKRQAGVAQTSLILVADIVGTGILGLPGHIAKLGWVKGVLALALCMIANLYTGTLLGRLGAAYPSAVSYSDLARQLAGAW